jgi:hypothetical protein
MPTDRKTAARLVAIVCAAQVFVQLGAGYWPVLLPELMGRWSLSNSEAGWVTSAFYAAYMVCVPVLVTLTDRIDAKRVYLFGVACTIVAHFAFGALADGFWSALALRALAGVGWAGTYMTGLKMLADQVDARMMSRAVTGHAASIGISGAASYVLGELLAEAFGWRYAFASAGLTAAVAWLTVALAVPVRPAPAKTSAALFDFRPVLRNRSALAYSLAYCVHTLEMNALRGWGVAFLTWVAASTGLSAADHRRDGPFDRRRSVDRLRRLGRLPDRGRAGRSLRHDHLARLVVAHCGGRRLSRAFTPRRPARGTLDAGLCWRLRGTAGDRLDARSRRRHVVDRLGPVFSGNRRVDGAGSRGLHPPAAARFGRRPPFTSPDTGAVRSVDLRILEPD